MLKYLSSLFILLCALNSGVALGQTSTLANEESFNKSDALRIVLDAIYDASFDFEGLYIVSHNIDFVSSKSERECEIVSYEALETHFEKIFQHFISYYPDEDLPYDQAIQDLRQISGRSEFKRCQESMDGLRGGQIEVTHYESLETPLWIRIEYNTEQ